MLVGLATRPVTVAVLVSATRATVAVLEPATAEAVTFAEPATVPCNETRALPWASVVLDEPDRAPVEVDQVTGAPATGLPLASSITATSSLESAPFALMVVGVAVRLTTFAVEPSGTKVTVALCAPATAAADTLAVPATVPCSVTRALPWASVVLDALDRAPAEVDQLTGAPATGLP